ncbi:MAG: mechanosensitive ion channel family protein [Clostridia bacterium]|nr:mechanosensitive ion channel family protein [Clostridia bacterium]
MSAENVVKEVNEYIGILQGVTWQQGLTALLILVGGLIISKFLLRSLSKLLEKSKSIPKTLHGTLRTILRIVLDLLVILTAANAIGIPTTAFVALLSIVSLAITLSLQGILSNLAGSFIILISKPIAVDDFIELDGMSGTVKEIKMMYTKLEAPDGRSLYIPNSRIYTVDMINYNQNGRRRVEVDVSASYDAHPETVRKAILQAVEETGCALDNPAPMVWLLGYGDSAIQYRAMFWCTSNVFITAKFDFTERLYDTFKQNGVQMTYPHVNVHMQ